MERAFQAMIQRHEVLRTSFHRRDGEPVQVVQPHAEFRLSTIDLTGLGESDRAAESIRIGSLAARTPFDLSCAPLLRATLLRIDATRSQLLVTVHHVVSDGWSIGILAREVGESYRAIREHRAASLPELPVQYGDYALWQRQWLSANALERQTGYWLQKLKGMRYFELASDRPRAPLLTANGQIVSVLLPRRLTDQLAALSQDSGCTLFMTALAALKVLLHHRTGEEDIAVGTQVAGRDQVELEGLVGPFINTLVLRDDLSGNPTFLAFLARIRETVVGALSNAEMPIQHLTAQLKPPRDLSRHPLFSVNFIFQRSFIANADYGDYRLTDIPSLTPGAIYDLNFFMVERPDGWRTSCEFNTDLFDTDTVIGLLESYRALLEEISHEPTSRLSDLGPPQPVRYADAAIAVPRAPVNISAGHKLSDDVQRDIARIWHAILEVHPTSAEADFFELGGHSLLAARMLARVEASLGRRIPLINFLRAPTLGGLARLLHEDTASLPDDQVIMVQPHGGRPAAFAINNTGLFFPLARRLGRDQPFIALQRYDPEVPQEIEPRTFEDIAADYVRIIRRVRPHGPYVLVGLCARGALAYEIAQQLVRQGEEIPLLIMIDTWAPGYLRRLSRLRRILAELSFRVQLNRTQIAVVTGGVPGKLRHVARRTFEKLHLVTRQVEKEDWYHPHLMRALRDYQPKPYAGRVLLLPRQNQPAGRFLAADLGWSELLTGDYRLKPLPHASQPGSRVAGTLLHLAMFREPGVGLMANHITRALQNLNEGDAEQGTF
jgi:thioesterase domain-containing protein